MDRSISAGLRFLLMVAVRKIFPDAQLLVEHGRESAYYASLKGRTVTGGEVAAIRSYMTNMVAQELPILEMSVNGSEAVRILAQDGQSDKLNMVEGLERVSLYWLEGIPGFLHGDLPNNTGELRGFTLKSEKPGMLLGLPGASAVHSSKMNETFKQAEHWADILGCGTVADINKHINNGMLTQLIEINEAFHEKCIISIADRITRSGKKVVFIAGPTASGKTTFARRLMVHLAVDGQNPLPLSTDDYFFDRETAFLRTDGKLDLESIEIMDAELLNSHLHQLLAGEPVQLPYFDFLNGKRGSHDEPVQTRGPVLLEGIHALNPLVIGGIEPDKRFCIYINALSPLNLDDTTPMDTSDGRLIRRIVRDALNRGHTAEQTLKLWPSVMTGELKYITPHREQADIFFNSALFYEGAVMKQYLLPLLGSVPFHSPVREVADWLSYLVSRFADCGDISVPSGSILQEFIG